MARTGVGWVDRSLASFEVVALVPSEPVVGPEIVPGPAHVEAVELVFSQSEPPVQPVQPSVHAVKQNQPLVV